MKVVLIFLFLMGNTPNWCYCQKFKYCISVYEKEAENSYRYSSTFLLKERDSTLYLTYGVNSYIVDKQQRKYQKFRSKNLPISTPEIKIENLKLDTAEGSNNYYIDNSYAFYEKNDTSKNRVFFIYNAEIKKYKIFDLKTSVDRFKKILILKGKILSNQIDKFETDKFIKFNVKNLYIVNPI